MDLRDRLQSTLRGSYILERELGGGGMSRVFLAEELRLRRKVVVKVLSPELSQGISVDRFEREIQTVAALQQANIVGVLAAGDTDGLPYYTMPYVEGESLRARLARGPLAVTEVVGILRDVSKALAYAHQRGVVHRDIKPDNVLLSGGAAVVADFGIAKAISASRTAASASTLTQAGTSIGTPAYMSPEQSAGDPDIDARADIYSFGAMAYELLAGQPPFAGRPPQRLLAAHMSETPVSIATLRPDVPAPLADLVMRCLEKDANDRPQTAGDIARELETVSSGDRMPSLPPMLVGGHGMFRKALAIYAVSFTIVAVAARAAIAVIGLPDWVFPGALVVMALGLPVVLWTGYAQRVAYRAQTATPTRTPGGTPVAATHGTMAAMALRTSVHVSWYKTARGGVLAIGAFVVAVAAFMAARALGIGPFGSLLVSGQVGKEPLIVAEFQAVRADTSLGAVIAQAVRANLDQSSAFKLMPQTSVTAALQRMRRPLDSRIDLPLAREIAAREGLKAIVDGEIDGVGGGFNVIVRLVTADSARVLASFHAPAANSSQLIDVVDKLSRQLRGRIGESLREVHAAPALGRATTSSLDALRKFTEAYRATGAGDPERAIALDREAVAIDSNFALAWRHLAGAMGNAGYSQGSIDSALTRAYRLRDRVGDVERLLLTAAYFGQSGHDRAKAIAAYEAMVAAGDFSNTNPLGQLLASRRDFALADSFALYRVRMEPGYAITYGNLESWQLAEGRIAAAESTLALADARLPGSPASGARAAARAELLYARGDVDGAVALLEGALQRLTGAARTGSLNALSSLALLRGELRKRDALLREARALRRPSSAPTDVVDSVGAIVEDAWFGGPSPRLAERLDALAASSAFSSQPPAYRAYLPVARAYALAGRPDRARAMLTRYQAEVRDTSLRREDEPRVHGVLGEIALAERRPADAASEFRREDVAPDGPASSCAGCLPAMLARTFDAMGQADSAIAAIERYLALPRGARAYGSTLPRFRGFWPGDFLFLPALEEELARLYEKTGDAGKAAEHYREFIALWKGADARLQARVGVARGRLARLTAAEGTRR